LTALAVVSNLCPHCCTRALVNDAGEIICLLCGRNPELDVLIAPTSPRIAARQIEENAERAVAYYKKKNCPTCGDAFTSPGRYCSDRCIPVKVCLVCGQSFVQDITYRIYCGKECVQLAQSRRRRGQPLATTLLLKRCLVCRGHFSTNSSHKMLCGSEDCRKEYKRRRMREYAAAKKSAQGSLPRVTIPLEALNDCRPQPSPRGHDVGDEGLRLHPLY